MDKCPLCGRDMDEDCELDYDALKLMRCGWKIAPLIHDLLGDIQAVLVSLEVVNRQTEGKSIEESAEKLAYAGDLIDSLRDVPYYVQERIGAADSEAIVPLGEIEGVHDYISHLFGFDFSIDTEEFDKTGLRIDLRSYSAFISMVFQIILMTIGRVINPYVFTSYKIIDFNMLMSRPKCMIMAL